MPESLLPTPTAAVARLTEATPALLTVEALVNPTRDFPSLQINTALTTLLTVENAHNAIDALRTKEWGAACVAAVSTGIWGSIAAYDVRTLSGGQPAEVHNPSRAKAVLGIGALVGLTIGQRFVNRRLGK